MSLTPSGPLPKNFLHCLASEDVADNLSTFGLVKMRWFYARKKIVHFSGLIWKVEENKYRLAVIHHMTCMMMLLMMMVSLTCS